MARDTQVTVVNPLDPGNGGHTVESAARGFSEMLAREDAPSSSEISGRRDRRSAPRPRVAEPDNEDGEGQARRAAPQARDGDGADDGSDDPFADDILTLPAERQNTDPAGDDDEPGEGDDEPPADDEPNPEDDDDDFQALLDTEITVKVAGEEKTVKIGELASGYMREADYRQKTARVASEYQEVRDYAKETIEARQQYVQGAQEIFDLVESLYPAKSEWEALETKDPQGFIAAQKYWQGISERVAAIKTGREKATQDEATENNRVFKLWAAAEDRKLLEAVPALANPKRAKEFRDRIFDYGKKAGFSEKEIVGVFDHRQILTLYKAARYDEILASRNGGKNRNTGPKRGQSPARGIARNARKAEGTRALRRADDRLAKSGSVAAAGQAFAEMIRSE